MHKSAARIDADREKLLKENKFDENGKSTPKRWNKRRTAEKRKKEDVFFEIATAKEERKNGSDAQPLRPANCKRPRRTGIGSENGRRADECRPAAGLWRFFFYETAAGTLTADRLHASKTVCFKLYVFALKIKWLTKFRQRIVKRKNAESIALRIRGGFPIRCERGGAPTWTRDGFSFSGKAVSNDTKLAKTSCANGLIISKIKNKSEQSELCSDVAEKEGFEPSRRVNAYTISSRAPSTKLGDFSMHIVRYLIAPDHSSRCYYIVCSVKKQPFFAFMRAKSSCFSAKAKGTACGTLWTVLKLIIL